MTDSTLGKVRLQDWNELQYIQVAALSFTQKRLHDLERVANCFNESLSDAFEDVLYRGLQQWLEMCDITDMADKGGNQ